MLFLDMRIPFLFFFSAICTGVFSQQKINYPKVDNFAVWYATVNAGNDGISSTTYFWGKDTMINNLPYKRVLITDDPLSKTGWTYEGAVREDQLLNKLFFIPVSESVEADITFLDTFQLGDTLKISPHLSSVLPSGCCFVIDSMYNDTSDNIIRTVYLGLVDHSVNHTTQEEGTWYEFTPSLGLFASGVSEYYKDVECYSLDAANYDQNLHPGCDIISSAGETNRARFESNLMFFNNELRAIGISDEKMFNFSVFTVGGQLIWRKSSTFPVLIPQFTSGLYTVVIDRGLEQFSKKIWIN